VNSAVACALTAAKLGVKVAHVEAGPRSFDRTMPEEFNRVLTDHIAELLFTTEPSANENRSAEASTVSPSAMLRTGSAEPLSRSPHAEGSRRSLKKLVEICEGLEKAGIEPETLNLQPERKRW